MDKYKLTVFIFSLILIAFIVAVSIRESTTKPQTQCVTIIQSPENDTTEITVSTTRPEKISKTKANQNSDVIETTATASVPVTDNIAVDPEPLYVNINIASQEELMQLPDIGEILAGRIIGYRETYGYFRNTEEIMLVNGIGDGIFSRICEYIYVDDPVYDEEIISEPEQNDEPEEEYPEIPAEEITEIPEFTLEDVIPIDLNTTDAETLMLLPHVNEEIAFKIIELRENIGGFRHPYEIYYVECLEQHEVYEILEFVTVNP